MSWPWRFARYGLAAYFGLVGVAVLLYEAGLLPEPSLEREPRASGFLRAMTDTGFLNHLLATSFIAAAAALVRHRTAPLGIAILAPSVVGIFLFHLMLSGRFLWGALWAIWLAALAWHYRRAFVALWTYGEDKS
jgi:hypothetical protein